MASTFSPTKSSYQDHISLPGPEQPLTIFSPLFTFLLLMHQAQRSHRQLPSSAALPTQPSLTLVTSSHAIVCLSKKNESSQHKRIPIFSFSTACLGQSQWDWSCTPSHLQSSSECRHCLSSELPYVSRDRIFSRITYADRWFIKCSKKPTMLI